jgi:hypothetical protein
MRNASRPGDLGCVPGRPAFPLRDPCTIRAPDSFIPQRAHVRRREAVEDQSPAVGISIDCASRALCDSPPGPVCASEGFRSVGEERRAPAPARLDSILEMCHRRGGWARGERSGCCASAWRSPSFRRRRTRAMRRRKQPAERALTVERRVWPARASGMSLDGGEPAPCRETAAPGLSHLPCVPTHERSRSHDLGVGTIRPRTLATTGSESLLSCRTPQET